MRAQLSLVLIACAVHYLNATLISETIATEYCIFIEGKEVILPGHNLSQNFQLVLRDD